MNTQSTFAHWDQWTLGARRLAELAAADCRRDFIGALPGSPMAQRDPDDAALGQLPALATAFQSSLTGAQPLESACHCVLAQREVSFSEAETLPRL